MNSPQKLRQKSSFDQVPVKIPLTGIDGGVPWLMEHLHGGEQPALSCGKLDHYVLCWATRGCGKMRLRMMDRDLPKGRLYLLRPGTIQTFLSYPLEGWLLRFRSSCLFQQVSDRLQLHFLGSRPFVELTEVQIAQLEMLAEQLWNVQAETPEPALARSYITLLAELAANFYRQANAMRSVHVHERLLVQLLELVDRGFREQRSTDFYARKLGVVGRKLNEISLNGTGFLVPELIEDRRLAEAEHLLATTKLIHKEIAHALGFISSSHFNFWFRQRRGMHPKAYRQRALGDTSYR